MYLQKYVGMLEFLKHIQVTAETPPTNTSHIVRHWLDEDIISTNALQLCGRYYCEVSVGDISAAPCTSKPNFIFNTFTTAW